VPSPILAWGACQSLMVAGRVDKLPMSQPFESRLNAPGHSVEGAIRATNAANLDHEKTYPPKGGDL
jgi:hypothetical protein